MPVSKKSPKPIEGNRPKSERWGAFLVWNVPDEVRQRFHEACVHKGVTMKETIIEFLEEFARA